VFESQPPRNRKLYAGDKVSALLQDFYPQNTIEVNGESFYKAHLSNLARALEVRSDYFHQVEAFVKLEPENPHDKNAVAVYVHDQRVGYVNRIDAPVFQEALKDIDGQAWVMAAIKHVTEIDQYRVRLMVQVPVVLDPRAYPLIDLSELEEVVLEKAGRGWGGIRRLNWRRENLERGNQIQFAGPATVLLTCVHKADGTSAVKMIGSGTTIREFSADEFPDLYDAVLEVNQAAWATVSFVDRGDGQSVSMFFVSGEGFPKIQSLWPGAGWPIENEDVFLEDLFIDIETDTSERNSRDPDGTDF
jgi:hypothetical protein